MEGEAGWRVRFNNKFDEMKKGVWRRIKENKEKKEKKKKKNKRNWNGMDELIACDFLLRYMLNLIVRVLMRRREPPQSESGLAWWTPFSFISQFSPSAEFPH